MTPEESTKKLKEFLANQRVSPAIVKYMTDAPGGTEPGIGMEAVSDFASYFTRATFETGCAERIAAQTEDKDNEMAIGRLRTAWRMAVAELEKAEAAVKTGAASTDDWDAPLNEKDEAERKATFDGAYDNLRYDQESQPAATLVGRGYREFTNGKREMSLTPLKKMRSEADYRHYPQHKKEKLAGESGLEITYTDPVPKLPDIDFKTMLQLQAAMKLLTNMWTMTGAGLVDSKTEYDQQLRAFKKVRMCHMTQATSYNDFFMRKGMEHPGPEHKTIAWLIDRDRQTRSKARGLFQQGWPWGEAIIHSRDVLCQVLWTCGAKGITDKQVPVVGDPLFSDQQTMEVDSGAQPLSSKERQRLQQLEAADRQRKQAREQALLGKGKKGKGDKKGSGKGRVKKRGGKKSGFRG